jgi:hypothetical protein
MKTETRQSLDRLLQASAALPIEDGGFSQRVAAALPPPSPARAGWWKPALILGSTALGSILAVVLAPGGTSVLQGYSDLAAARFLTPQAMAALASVLALAVGSAVLASED